MAVPGDSAWGRRVRGRRPVCTSLAALIVCVVALAGCDEEKPGKGGDAAPGTTPMKIGIAIPSYVHAVAWIAGDRGLFERQKLDAEVQVMGGSAATMRTLIAEQIDVGLAGGDAVLKAREAGADLVIVGGLVNRFYHRFVARDGIDEAEDLRGSKVGLPFLGGPQDMAVKVALEELGLAYGKDVEVLSLGKEMNRMAALERGEIDATTSQTPPPRLAELDLEVLVDLPAADTAFPYMQIVVRRDDLADHRDRVKAVVRALCDATAFYEDEAQEKASLEIVRAHIRGGDTEGASRERYRAAGPGLLSLPPNPNREALETVTRHSAIEASAIDAAVDASLVQELVAAGECGG